MRFDSGFWVLLTISQLWAIAGYLQPSWKTVLMTIFFIAVAAFSLILETKAAR